MKGDRQMEQHRGENEMRPKGRSRIEGMQKRGEDGRGHNVGRVKSPGKGAGQMMHEGCLQEMKAGTQRNRKTGRGNRHDETNTLKQAPMVGVVGIGVESIVENRMMPTLIDVVARVNKTMMPESGVGVSRVNNTLTPAPIGVVNN